jgi:hypothetical protein
MATLRTKNLHFLKAIFSRPLTYSRNMANVLGSGDGLLSRYYIQYGVFGIVGLVLCATAGFVLPVLFTVSARLHGRGERL